MMGQKRTNAKQSAQKVGINQIIKYKINQDALCFGSLVHY